MRKELVESNHWKSITKMAWIPPDNWLEVNCPRCYDWIQEISAYPIKFIRFHLTPPRGKLNIHVDGTIEEPRKYALNIPFMNYENALMKWYDYGDMSNWKNDYVEPREQLYNAKGGVPVDASKCKVIEEAVIDWPTFLRTDIPHSIDNPNEEVRVILSVRYDCDEDIELRELIPSRHRVQA